MVAYNVLQLVRNFNIGMCLNNVLLMSLKLCMVISIANLYSSRSRYFKAVKTSVIIFLQTSQLIWVAMHVSPTNTIHISSNTIHKERQSCLGDAVKKQLYHIWCELSGIFTQEVFFFCVIVVNFPHLLVFSCTLPCNVLFFFFAEGTFSTRSWAFMFWVRLFATVATFVYISLISRFVL